MGRQITGRKTNAVRSRVSVHARAPLTCRFTNTSCLNHLATVHTIDYNAFSSTYSTGVYRLLCLLHLPTPHRVASINVQAILKYHRVFRWCGAVFIQSVISKHMNPNLLPFFSVSSPSFPLLFLPFFRSFTEQRTILRSRRPCQLSALLKISVLGIVNSTLSSSLPHTSLVFIFVKVRIFCTVQN